MNVFKGKFHKWALVSGIFFMLSYFFQDFLYKRMWVFSFLLMLLLAITFLVVFILGLIKRDRSIIPVFIAMIGLVAVREILISDILKAEKFSMQP